MSKLKAAVIGVGGISNEHINGYIKNPDVSNINYKINRISIEISKTILLNKNSEKIEKLNIEL